MSSNIEVKLDVLNQKASPALYAAPLANRPAASFDGRLFVDTDNPSTGIYRDTGTNWIQVAAASSGASNLQSVTTIGNTTNTGIAISANGLGIGTTIPASNRIDIHSASGLQGTFNGTGTTNAGLQLQSAGVGKWTIQNNYNTAENDFVITDVSNSLNRLTIKNTGQTFVGSDTSSSGLLVVNSATSDNHIVVIGANAPSIRLRNTGTSPTLNAGFGISTATNNFIQGSASGNYCIFNASTTASPILFGVYDAGAGNTQEVARITASRNFLIGTTSDDGTKLKVNGTGYFSDILSGTTCQFGGGARSIYFNPIVTACRDTNDKITMNVQNSFNGSGAYSLYSAGAYGNSWYWGLGSNTSTYGNNFILADDLSSSNVPCIIVATGSGNVTMKGSIAVGNTVTSGVAVASTHKVSILIGGVQYYLLASNV